MQSKYHKKLFFKLIKHIFICHLKNIVTFVGVLVVDIHLEYD